MLNLFKDRYGQKESIQNILQELYRDGGMMIWVNNLRSSLYKYKIILELLKPLALIERSEDGYLSASILIKSLRNFLLSKLILYF